MRLNTRVCVRLFAGCTWENFQRTWILLQLSRLHRWFVVFVRNFSKRSNSVIYKVDLKIKLNAPASRRLSCSRHKPNTETLHLCFSLFLHFTLHSGMTSSTTASSLRWASTGELPIRRWRSYWGWSVYTAAVVANVSVCSLHENSFNRV